jgi:Tfp pilus assembly protein PilO
MNARRQILISAGAAVLVTILFFFFLLKPKLTEISDAQSDTQTAVDRESTLRTELVRLEALRKQEPQTRAKLAKLKAYLPTTPDLPGFIRLAQSSATGAGIDLTSIAPSQPSEMESARGIQIITATLTVQGGFHRMENFLTRLENLPRVVEVRSLALSPISVLGQTVLDGTIGVTMYVVSDDATLTGSARRTSPRPSATPTTGGAG